jgi:hypothetical protein
MTTTRQNPKLCAFPVCGCPTAESDCPRAAFGVIPPVEAISVEVEAERKPIVKAFIAWVHRILKITIPDQ